MLRVDKVSTSKHGTNFELENFGAGKIYLHSLDDRVDNKLMLIRKIYEFEK